jgi:hypothetical protein
MSGCLGVQLLRNAGNAARFVLVEKWESVDTHAAAVAAFSGEEGKSIEGDPNSAAGGCLFQLSKRLTRVAFPRNVRPAGMA